MTDLSYYVCLKVNTTRKHFSRVHTARLPTINVLGAANRCQYQGVGIPWDLGYPTPMSYSSPWTYPSPVSDTWWSALDTRHTPYGQTDTCENIITFSQFLLRAVIISICVVIIHWSNLLRLQFLSDFYWWNIQLRILSITWLNWEYCW